MDNTHKILCAVSYSGMNFLDFDRHYGTRTVCGELEKAFSKATGQRVRVDYGFSTDARASAKKMPVVAMMESEVDAAAFRAAAEHYLPSDIKLSSAKNVPDTYDIRQQHFMAEYDYSIVNEKDSPFADDSYVYVEAEELDLDIMREASTYLLGENDLSCFCEKRGFDTYRTIHEINIESFRNRIFFSIIGDALQKYTLPMIVCELLLVGKGLRSPEYIPELLAKGDVDELQVEMPTLLETVSSIVAMERPDREIHSCNDRWDYYVLNMDAESQGRSYVIIRKASADVFDSLLRHIVDRTLRMSVKELFIIDSEGRVNTKMDLGDFTATVADVKEVDAFNDRIASYRMRGTWYRIVRGTKVRMVER